MMKISTEIDLNFVTLCLGVYSASFDRQLEWVIIKGISHYADGGEHDAKWRRFSSAMAASVVFNILKQSNGLKGWKHYEETG